ncbi:hypothetical protein PF049_14240 (plasmid) [Erythrobacteraceae bacterium WH01K]|nr:hypothetical protein PF049_14240 [Erythrobacteraceae bacterium WH01K]
MRIKMAGAYTTYEFLDAMDCIVQSLKVNGMEEIRGANLYLQPFRYGRLLDFQGSGNRRTICACRVSGAREAKIQNPVSSLPPGPLGE